MYQRIPICVLYNGVWTNPNLWFPIQLTTITGSEGSSGQPTSVARSSVNVTIRFFLAQCAQQSSCLYFRNENNVSQERQRVVSLPYLFGSRCGIEITRSQQSFNKGPKRTRE